MSSATSPCRSGGGAGLSSHSESSADGFEGGPGCGPGLGAVPRRGRDGRGGGPVDVVGDQVQDGLDITAAERLVHLPGRLDVLLGAHDRDPPLSLNPDQAQKAVTAAGSPTNCSMARRRPPSTVTSTTCGPSIVRPSGRLALSRTGTATRPWPSAMTDCGSAC